MPSANAVSLKISRIEGEDFGSAERFRSNNDRSVCEIHWMIPVLFHQLEHSCRRGVVQKPYGCATIEDEVTKTVGTDTIRCQQMKGSVKTGMVVKRGSRMAWRILLHRVCSASWGSNRATNGPVSTRIIGEIFDVKRAACHGGYRSKAQSHTRLVRDQAGGKLRMQTA